MKKEKETKVCPDIDKKVILVKNILNNIYQIMNLIKPIFDLILTTEEAKLFQKDGTFEKMALLFGQISNYSKQLEGTYPLSN